MSKRESCGIREVLWKLCVAALLPASVTAVERDERVLQEIPHEQAFRAIL
ncbi:MAG: hypothetical protein WAM90_14770 [Rhodanobacter sp.]